MSAPSKRVTPGAPLGTEAETRRSRHDAATTREDHPAQSQRAEATAIKPHVAPTAPSNERDAAALISRLALCPPTRIAAEHRISVALLLGETVLQAYTPILLGALSVASRLTIKVPSPPACSNRDTISTNSRMRGFVEAAVNAYQRGTPPGERPSVRWLEQRLNAAELDAFCAGHALVYAQGNEALMRALRQRLDTRRLIERGPAYGAAIIDLRGADTAGACATLARALAKDFFDSGGLGCMHPRTAVCIGEPKTCASFIEELRVVQPGAGAAPLCRFALEAAARGRIFPWGAGTLAHLPSPNRLIVAEHSEDLPIHSVACPQEAAALLLHAPKRIRAIASAPFPLASMLVPAISTHGNVRIAPLGTLQATVHDTADEGWDPLCLFRTRAALLGTRAQPI